MSTLAKLVVKLITDVSEFDAGMKNAAKKLDKIGTSMAKTGRNDPCPCGSGKKYKLCCSSKDDAAAWATAEAKQAAATERARAFFHELGEQMAMLSNVAMKILIDLIGV